MRIKPLALAALTCCQLAAIVAFAAPPEVIRKWDFHSPTDAAGWKPGNDLKDLTVSGDRLRMTISGQDAYLFLPPLDVPLDGLRVRIRMSCNHPGETQVFWLTVGQNDYAQDQMIAIPNPAAEQEPVTLDFQIGELADAGKRLTGLRIDPCNGNKDGTVEIVSVELLRMPAILDVNCSFSAAQIGLNEDVRQTVSVRQTEGASLAQPLMAELAGGPRQPLRLAPASQPAGQSAITTRFDRPGVHQSAGTLLTGDTRYDLETAVIVGKHAQLPLKPALRSDRLRLDLIPSSDGTGIGAARWQIADAQGEWHQCGWLLPLAELAIGRSGSDRQTRSVQKFMPSLMVVEQSERVVRLEGHCEGWSISVRLALVERGELQAIEAVSQLTAGGDRRLLAFSGPVLRANRDPAGDPLDRSALFGGLEFLEPGWRSSSDRAVGPKFADRWSPHPFKVTVPVMAVEAGGVTTALMWDPQQGAAAVGQGLPTATFASPNFLDGQNAHLMKLSAPSIPAHVHENESLAREPLAMKKGRKITLRYLLYAEPGLPVVYTTQRWYQLFGPVTAPLMPQDDKATYDLIARNFGETMYWPKEKGWTYHWYFPESPHWIGHMAGELIAHSITTGDKQYVEKTGLSGRGLVETLGPVAPQIPDGSAARAAIAAMRTDGTFAFHNTAEMRKKTRHWSHGRFDSLGDEDSTSLGTCVQAAMPIIRRAQLTGDPESMQALQRALEAMSRFRVPRGAQVWEVHQDIPDIRAAALAIEAFRIGYEVTGEQRWLDQASYWAWTGVPFIYSWHVPIDAKPASVLISRERHGPFTPLQPEEVFLNPARQVTPFGVVPVLGPTYYVVNWFGVLVQWCGLEWACKVIDLDRDRPDVLLRSIADGVLASGFQQTLDRPPWLGLYPDSWDLQANRVQPAYISATMPLESLRSAGRTPPWTQNWTRVVRDDTGQRRWHVTGWGRPVSIPPPQPGSWTATVAFPPGQPNELIVANIDAPRLIRAGDDLLQRQEKPEPGAVAKAGWWYWPDQRALIVHFKQAAEETAIKIEW